MTFGEKLKKARLALNYSQSEVGELSRISERSLYTYEQTGTMPRTRNIRKLVFLQSPFMSRQMLLRLIALLLFVTNSVQDLTLFFRIYSHRIF